jgi:hypothetical protein
VDRVGWHCMTRKRLARSRLRGGFVLRCTPSPPHPPSRSSEAVFSELPRERRRDAGGQGGRRGTPSPRTKLNRSRSSLPSTATSSRLSPKLCPQGSATWLYLASFHASKFESLLAVKRNSPGPGASTQRFSPLPLMSRPDETSAAGNLQDAREGACGKGNRSESSHSTPSSKIKFLSEESLLPALFLFPPKVPSRCNSVCRSTACTSPTFAPSPSGQSRSLPGFEPRLPKFARRRDSRGELRQFCTWFGELAVFTLTRCFWIP